MPIALPKTARLKVARSSSRHANRDLADLARADDIFSDLLADDPGNSEALIGLGSISLSRHDFSAGLELGQDALAAAPRSSRAQGIVVDALMELGRYEEAANAIEQMLRLRPDLASYSRLSYFHETHGRLEPAIDAMERAVIAAGPFAENTEFTRVHLADLWLLAGDTERAAQLYRTTLRNLPDFTPASHGLARVAVARGNLDTARTHLLQAIALFPLPELLLPLGELQERAGDDQLAQATYASALALEAFHREATGVPEPFGAILEADHGDPATALVLAREAYRLAPSIAAADALAWGLYHDERLEEAMHMVEKALSTGSTSPGLLYRAGVVAAASGDTARAKELLERSALGVAAATPLLAQRIDRALADLVR